MASQEGVKMSIGVTQADKACGAKEFSRSTVPVEPGRTKQLAVGSYAVSEREPEFALRVEPDIGSQLGVSLERLDIPGTSRYVLFYHLCNFSEKLCMVTAERRNVRAAFLIG